MRDAIPEGRHQHEKLYRIVMATYETVVKRHLGGVLRFVLSKSVYSRIVSCSNPSVHVYSDQAAKMYLAKLLPICTVGMKEEDSRYVLTLSDAVTQCVIWWWCCKRRGRGCARRSCVVCGVWCFRGSSSSTATSSFAKILGNFSAICRARIVT